MWVSGGRVFQKDLEHYDKGEECEDEGSKPLEGCGFCSEWSEAFGESWTEE